MAALLRAPPAIGRPCYRIRLFAAAAALLASASSLLAFAFTARLFIPSATFESFQSSLSRSPPSIPPISSRNSSFSTLVASRRPFLAQFPLPTGNSGFKELESSVYDLKVPPFRTSEASDGNEVELSPTVEKSSQNPNFSTVMASSRPFLAQLSLPPVNSSRSGLESSDDDSKVPPFSTSEASPTPCLPISLSSDGKEVELSSIVVKSSENPNLSSVMASPPYFLAEFPLSAANSSPNVLESTGDGSKVPLFTSSEANAVTFIKTEVESGTSGTDDLKVLSSSSEVHVRSMSAVDRELMHARREIENVPSVLDDPDLYAPLFRNVSVFKRSYELMERVLKVYIYKDGPRPIFHTPPRKGIYASEGWFMKLMEENRNFVVKDPNKAHLFYLPYSSHQLAVALYKPDSHNMRALSVFLKNYVDRISSKYPFWNRTRGADHFLVACHDWGPYTTQLHDELHKNTIRALCNADLSEGLFVPGKDVSLPETTIRNIRRPLKDIGGKPVSQRSILAFFAGNMHGRVRPILLNYWSGKHEDMKIYGPLPYRIARKMSYVQHMKSSKFCICPMGYEVNSPRIVEAIYYECVPVIIADNFVPPFDEVLNWSAFSLIVGEKDIPNLKDILLGISLQNYVEMQDNVKRLQKHFLWHSRPVKYDIFHMILHSVWLSRLKYVEIYE